VHYAGNSPDDTNSQTPNGKDAWLLKTPMNWRVWGERIRA